MPPKKFLIFADKNGKIPFPDYDELVSKLQRAQDEGILIIFIFIFTYFFRRRRRRRRRRIFKRSTVFTYFTTLFV